jgi:hypothetical protein
MVLATRTRILLGEEVRLVPRHSSAATVLAIRFGSCRAQGSKPISLADAASFRLLMPRLGHAGSQDSDRARDTRPNHPPSQCEEPGPPWQQGRPQAKFEHRPVRRGCLSRQSRSCRLRLLVCTRTSFIESNQLSVHVFSRFSSIRVSPDGKIVSQSAQMAELAERAERRWQS